ncbi:RHS repeat-associated protein [Lachnotalea glycerini]|uniref:RHS repeat-associated protein n=1 Tax=Lachnotalea glycerini TaxID=1763509 RepID=A0A318EQJ2_9FIRM|nr:RHS repeat-associated protein [Lachnotalea glycerini]
MHPPLTCIIFDPMVHPYFSTGNFTQEDTYRGDGLNLYAYCANNPVSYVDPSGNICETAANRIMSLMDEGKIKGKNKRQLESYLRNKQNKGGLTSQEQEVAKKLGVNGGNKSSGGSTEVILPSKPHKNGTEGHWETILDEVDVMKQSGEYDKIYVNKGLSNEVPGAKPNRRPDIMGVKKDGTIDQVEVPSKTDTVTGLTDRMKNNQAIIGDRAGTIKVKPVNNKYKKR